MSQPQNLKKATKHRHRGPSRLAVVTYPQIVEWTGFSIHTVRTYAYRRHFDPYDLDSVLSWVNKQRAKRGWSLIGSPEENSQPATLDTCENVTDYVTSLPTTGYNPRKGAFDL